jgi:hypothetical protein
MPLSRFSLSPSSGEYPDSDPHGGFNPNSFFAQPDPHRGGFNADLNAFPPGGINLNGSSPAHRRVPVHHDDQGRLSPSSSSYFSVAGQDARSPFGGMRGEDAMHHIINTGSTADGANTHEDGEVVIEEEEEEIVEEGGEYEEDDESVIVVAPAATVKGKKKAAPKKRGGSRGPKWRSLEDECLAEVWKTVSIDPDTYWERVKVSFDERKLMDPMFNKVHMDRNPSGMSHCLGNHSTSLQ